MILLLACAGGPATSATPGDGDSEPAHLDADSDGFAADDCDDDDPLVFPGADEHCDGVDEDCDGDADEDAIDAAMWFADADGDGTGDDTTAMSACAQPEGYVAVGGDCDDTDPDAAPGLVEVCGDESDNDCVDGDASCRLAGERSLADQDTRIAGAASESSIGGLQVSVVGAVGTSGTQAIGIPDQADPNVLCLVTPTEGTTVRAVDSLATIRIDREWYYDDAAHRGGDLTGDGVEDLLVATGHGADFDYEALLFAGPVTGALDAENAVFVLESTAIGTSTPASLRALQTGDATPPRIALGVSSNGLPAYVGGQIVLIEGPFVGDATPDSVVAVLNPQKFDDYLNLGHSLCAADLDGDGTSDIAAGAPSHSTAARDDWMMGGSVFIALGPFDGTLTLDDGVGGLDQGDGLWDNVPDAYARAGEILSCGDVDGDGLPDILVGSEHIEVTDDPENYGSGFAWLLSGPATGVHDMADATWAITGDDTIRGVGRAVTAESDLDGDGRMDVAIGSVGVEHQGLVGVFYGGDVTGTAGMMDADVTWTGAAPEDHAEVVAGGADFDADGFDDLAVGAYENDEYGEGAGMIYILYGGSD